MAGNQKRNRKPQGNGLPTPDRKEAQRRKTEAVEGKNSEQTNEKSTLNPRKETMGASNDSGAKKPLKQPKGQQSITNFVALETIGTKDLYEGPIIGEKHTFRQLPKATSKLQPFKKDEIYREESTKCHQMMMSASTEIMAIAKQQRLTNSTRQGTNKLCYDDQGRFPFVGQTSFL